MMLHLNDWEEEEGQWPYERFRRGAGAMSKHDLAPDTRAMTRWPVCGTLILCPRPSSLGRRIFVSNPASNERDTTLRNIVTGTHDDPRDGAQLYRTLDECWNEWHAMSAARFLHPVAAVDDEVSSGRSPPWQLTMPPEVQLVVNESVLSLIALRGTQSKVATPPQCAAEARAMRLPSTTEEALRRLADPFDAGSRARRWQHARDFLLVRAKGVGTLAERLRALPHELFRLVVVS